MPGPAATVRRDVVDGVPVFWVDAPGTFAMGLMFRVGRADETLVTGGVTHLVEHLALPTRRIPGVEFNGTVDPTVTSFWASGQREAVLGVLGETARQLHTLPLERLETERRILLTEAGSATHGPVHLAMLLRYGPRGHGLVGCDEYGLHALDAEAVQAWASTRFCAANAAVWMSGPPPDAWPWELPPGERFAPPEPLAVPDVVFPAVYEHGPDGGVSLAYEADRSYAVSVAMQAAEERARQRLRHGEGVSYDVHWAYDWLTRARAHGVFAADALETNAGAAAASLLDVLRELAEEGPTEDELRHDAEATRHETEDPGAAPRRTGYAAAMELFGKEFEPEEALMANRAAVTAEDAAAGLRATLDSVMVLVPAGTRPPRGLEPISLWCELPIAGRRLRPRGLPVLRGKLETTVVVGDEGVAVETPGGRAAVRFDDCVALLRWRDGTRACGAPTAGSRRSRQRPGAAARGRPRSSTLASPRSSRSTWTGTRRTRPRRSPPPSTASFAAAS